MSGCKSLSPSGSSITSPRVAATAEVRVRADGAHFREAGRGQSLTSHCGEAAVDVNPHEPAEFGSVFAERPRLCEAGEGYHLGKIRGLYREDSLAERGPIRNRRADHLNKRSTAKKLPVRRNLE